MTWEQLDWAALDRLRDLFLAGQAASGPYWKTRGELASYDLTYGERIGWKWDAVLAELDRRRWRPPAPGLAVLDWGCGAGVAGRRVVRWLGAERVSVLRLWDYSALAADYAVDAAREQFPALRIEHVTPGYLAGSEPVGVLVISHVLNELPASELLALRGLAERAAAILWVEPGTAEVSRALIDIREQLRDRFRVIAPCTHQEGCGLLAPENARHWCHHFAAPPSEIFADSDWARFGRRAGIDLRSLPYSFLVLAEQPPGVTPAADLARVIGAPRVYKGFARVLSCERDGVRELTVQKRDAPALYRQFKRPEGALVYAWRRDGDRILGGERLHPQAP